MPCSWAVQTVHLPCYGFTLPSALFSGSLYKSGSPLPFISHPSLLQWTQWNGEGCKKSDWSHSMDLESSQGSMQHGAAGVPGWIWPYELSYSDEERTAHGKHTATLSGRKKWFYFDQEHLIIESIHLLFSEVTSLAKSAWVLAHRTARFCM